MGVSSIHGRCGRRSISPVERQGERLTLRIGTVCHDGYGEQEGAVPPCSGGGWPWMLPRVQTGELFGLTCVVTGTEERFAASVAERVTV